MQLNILQLILQKITSHSHHIKIKKKVKFYIKNKMNKLTKGNVQNLL